MIWVGLLIALNATKKDSSTNMKIPNKKNRKKNKLGIFQKRSGGNKSPELIKKIF